jgi:Flp pilus assembly protein TadG
MRSRSRSGSAAIEFAFVAPVFFVLLFGIMEGGIMFFGRSALLNAVQDAARVIRTGQAQTGGISKSAFKLRVCDGIDELLNCDNLTVDVQAYPAGFSTPASPLDANGNLQAGQNNYNTGAPCDVVVVRAFYKYTVSTPLIRPLLTGKASKDFNYLTAAAAFRNEPFNAAVAGC